MLRGVSPFRDAPPLELGAMEVGLAQAARRAMAGLPRGGRVVTARPSWGAVHVMGALGSGGLLAVVAAVFVGWTSLSLGPSAVFAPPSPFAPSAATVIPSSGAELMVVLAVLVGGASLAAVLRAVDRGATHGTRSGEIVGRRAQRVLTRMARLARMAEAAPERFGRRRTAALKRTIEAAGDADLARWIPPDVRGRAELLLARATARAGGPRWLDDDARRDEVRALLAKAAERLDDGAPAATDLALIDGAPVSRRAEGRADPRHPAGRERVRLRIADRPVELEEAEAEAAADDDERAAYAGRAPRRTC